MCVGVYSSDGHRAEEEKELRRAPQREEEGEWRTCRLTSEVAMAEGGEGGEEQRIAPHFALARDLQP